MKIEKLELNGFKSFAEKTIFDLHPGTTCIVGPNGCGKSNIVDAFKWVLGEQSAKTLRGDRMEEVIFNGTAGKKPKGMAEVTLYILNDIQDDFDNNGKENKTIAVSRRIFRNSESEYYINRTRERLKDIRELFLDTGLEVRSYSIFEQEKISIILNANPVDRRFLIEEVAGVMKYKVRKTEATNKLERSRINLDRINDIIREIKRSINSLERQVQRAELYNQLTERLCAIEIKIAKRDYDSLKQAYEKLETENSEAIKNYTELTAKLSRIESDTEKKRLVLVDREKFLEIKTSEYQKLERGISDLEGDINLKAAEKNNIKGHLERLYKQKTELSSEKDKISIMIRKTNESEAQLLSDIEFLNNEIELKKNEIDSIEDFFDLTENENKEKYRQLFQISEDISYIHNEISGIQVTRNSLEQKIAFSKSSSDESLRTVNELKKEIKKFERDITDKQNLIELSNEKRASLVDRIQEVEQSIVILSRDISSVKEAIASDNARYSSLKEITLPNLNIESIKEEIDIVSSLSEVIDVPVKYESAVESALLERIKGIILKSKDDLKRAVNYVKRNALERNAFTSFDVTNKQLSINFSNYPVTKMCDIINTKGEFKSIIESVLGNFIIVENMDEAFDLYETNSGKYGSQAFYVTIDGDVLEPTGMVITGKGSKILRHIREIRELEEKISSYKKELGEMEPRLESLSNEKARLNRELQETSSQIFSIEKELSILRVTINKLEEEKERINKKIHFLGIEYGEIEKDIKSCNTMLNEKEESLRALKDKKKNIDSEIENIKGSLSEKRSNLETLRSSLTERKMSLSTIKERLKATQNERINLTKNVETIQEKISLINEEIASLKKRETGFDHDINLNRETINQLIKEADTQKRLIVNEKESIESKSLTLQDAEKSMKGLRQEVDSFMQLTGDLKLKLTEHRLEMDHIHKDIENKYNKSINTLLVEPLEEGEEEKLQGIKEKVKDIGIVNLASLDEHRDLKTRYDFLSSQRDDIVKSIAELEKAIFKINASTRKKLRDAYEELNVKFNEAFKSLFGGGRAELVLTDANNILESGIDIVVQPPGKKLQNINLLSGGEKSLSALSLIFAGFIIKPTPLCILDEADAALDEPNTRRFTEMLKRLSVNTQFIVVTHNRTTMEIADYIYGITTEEAGVSKVISMEMAEA